MILVDSSVWIEFLRSAPGRGGVELRRMIAEAEPIALTGIVVAEVLQGLSRNVSEIERHLRRWEMLEPHGFSTYREGAAIFRQGRAKGMGLSTIDCLIAATALEHGAALFTLDQDFSRIAHMTGLRLHTVPA